MPSQPKAYHFIRCQIAWHMSILIWNRRRCPTLQQMDNNGQKHGRKMASCTMKWSISFQILGIDLLRRAAAQDFAHFHAIPPCARYMQGRVSERIYSRCPCPKSQRCALFINFLVIAVFIVLVQRKVILRDFTGIDEEPPHNRFVQPIFWDSALLETTKICICSAESCDALPLFTNPSPLHFPSLLFLNLLHDAKRCVTFLYFFFFSST